MDFLFNVLTSVNTLNRQQFQSKVKRNYGFGVATPEPRVQDELNLFADANKDQIKKLPEQYVDRLKSQLTAGIKSGKSATELKTVITQNKDIMEARAINVARGEVANLNGSLTKVRQQDLGIEEYVWRGMLDSRERVSHLDREGRRYSWESGPPGGLHPGLEPQCRCWADPVFPTLTALKPGIIISP